MSTDLAGASMDHMPRRKEPTPEELANYARTLGVPLESLSRKQREALATLGDVLEGKQDFLEERARLGGLARAESLTPERRQEIAKKASEARLSKLTKQQRSEIAKKASAAAAKARKVKAAERRRQKKSN